MIADFVSFRRDSAPIVQPGCLGDDEEECGAQMTLVEFRNHHIEMHRTRVAKRQRQRGDMIVPGQNLERGGLRREAARQQTRDQDAMDKDGGGFHSYTTHPRCHGQRALPSQGKERPAPMIDRLE